MSDRSCVWKEAASSTAVTVGAKVETQEESYDRLSLASANDIKRVLFPEKYSSNMLSMKDLVMSSDSVQYELDQSRIRIDERTLYLASLSDEQAAKQRKD